MARSDRRGDRLAIEAHVVDAEVKGPRRGSSVVAHEKARNERFPWYRRRLSGAKLAVHGHMHATARDAHAEEEATRRVVERLGRRRGSKGNG